MIWNILKSSLLRLERAVCFVCTVGRTVGLLLQLTSTRSMAYGGKSGR
jgi:hypothetical protein